MDRQSQTRRLNDAVQQDFLDPPAPRRQPRSFTVDDVRRLKSESEAIRMSVDCSGYEDKEIPLLFKIDAGQWSNIIHGKKHFPHNRRNEFMDFVGNEILLMYGIESRGRDWSTLRHHQTDVELENEELKRKLAESEKKAAHYAEFVQTLMGRASK